MPSGEIVAIIVALFGASAFWTGFWQWAATRKKSKTENTFREEIKKREAEFRQELSEQEKQLKLETRAQIAGTNASLEAMQASVEFMRERLDASNMEYNQLQAHHNAEIAELRRQLAVSEAQFSDCKRLLHQKCAEGDTLMQNQARVERELEDIRSRIATKPLRDIN